MTQMMDIPATLPSIHADLQLRCPRCASPLSGFSCGRCRFEMREENGVWIAMPEERIAHFAEFVRDYSHVRSAQGRGSTSRDFYLNLPYRDTSGKNSGQWAIRAKTFDVVTQRLLTRSARPGMQRILDIGAGNGWMSYRLTLRGFHPVAVDLLTNSTDGLGAAENFFPGLPELFPRFQAESVHLPFADGQFDVAIFNASFHYAESYSASLSEALRCVRRGGLVIISDTPWYSRDESGQQMLAERKSSFQRQFGTASDSIHSMEYLTDERLRQLQQELSIRWEIITPWYGVKWAMRPWIARLRRRRTPSQFRIYVARKNA